VDDPIILDALWIGGGIVVVAIVLAAFWRPFTRRSHDDLGLYSSNDTSETYDSGHHGHSHSDGGGHGGDGGGH